MGVGEFLRVATKWTDSALFLRMAKRCSENLIYCLVYLFFVGFEVYTATTTIHSLVMLRMWSQAPSTELDGTGTRITNRRLQRFNR